MTDTTLINLSRNTARSNPLGALAKRLVFARLSDLREGQLRIYEGNDVHCFGNEHTGFNATITVLDQAFYAEVAFGGSVGAAESYMLGHWKSDDLTSLMRLFLCNREALDSMETGLAKLTAPIRVAAHWWHRNTLAGSRKNISAHYDLGNSFFRLFLDETMMYSCALFEHPDMSLRQASTAKLDAICQKLALSPEDHVLEIGTGWGGFAIHAARNYGCRVTTTTISPSQHELAVDRVCSAGLQNRITVLLKDYRDLTGTFDKLVSIELIEAVGHQYYGEFFQRCADRLIPGGQMLLQSITIADRHFARARDEVDFIKRYIFPGSCIPSISALAQAMSDSSDLQITQLEDIGPHYATTLARWRDNFFANIEQVRALGYPDSFCRMWEYYLSYCEAGFAERALGDVQMLLTRNW